MKQRLKVDKSIEVEEKKRNVQKYDVNGRVQCHCQYEKKKKKKKFTTILKNFNYKYETL